MQSNRQWLTIIKKFKVCSSHCNRYLIYRVMKIVDSCLNKYFQKKFNLFFLSVVCCFCELLLVKVFRDREISRF